jgi:adenylate cyclase
MPEPMTNCPGCGIEVGLDVANCNICGAAVGPQCPRCARQCRTGDQFCALCGGRLVGDDDASLEVIRRAERKLVSIVFIDMVGFTSLGHHHDAETVKLAMTQFFRKLAAVGRSHGGYVEKFIGDAMMTVWGLTNSREDDAVRALNAAIDMHAALAEVNAVWSARFQREVQIRVGVNSGVAIAGAIGEGRATDYGVSGDVVNTASRFQSAADPGETIIGETTRELAGRAFLYQPVAPLMLKGKPDPVPAFKLLGRAEAVTELFQAAPLIGRDAELARVREVARLVQDGRSAAVAVRGETGCGKTRFLEVLRHDEALARFRWISPRADGARPLALAGAIARELLGDAPPRAVAARLLGADDELAVGLVDWLLNGPSSAESAVGSLDPARRTEMLGDLLARAVGSSGLPVTIAIDNPERADAASMTLLARVAEGVDGARCLLTTTSGMAWTPPWRPVAQIELAELDAAVMDELLTATLGATEIDARARRALVEASSGNPLALTELVWAYRETGQLPKKRSGGVAGTILALVQARIDSVDEEAKRILQVGAVVGPTFEPALIGWVVGRGADVHGALSRLKRRTLLADAGDLVRFAQTAIRDVAYDGLLLAERRRLHRQTAIALESAGVDDPILLARHYQEGDDDTAAVGALARAAERHIAVGDLDAAHDALRAAVDRLGGRAALGEVTGASLLGRIADVLGIAGDLDAAADAFAYAVQALPNGLARAEMLRRQALVEHRRGEHDAALDALQAARDDVTLAELDGNESVEAVFTALSALAAAAARIHLGGDAVEEAIWEARQAIEMLSHLNSEQVAASTARRPIADASAVLAEALLARGDHGQAAEHADAARVAYAELHDLAGGLRADLTIGRARGMAGARGEARARVEAARALAHRLGDEDALTACTAALDELGVVVL